VHNFATDVKYIMGVM